MSLRTGRFWVDAAERAVKTAAQVAVGVLTADHVLGVIDVDFLQLGSVAALAALVSLLTSVGSSTVGDEDTASLVD